MHPAWSIRPLPSVPHVDCRLQSMGNRIREQAFPLFLHENRFQHRRSLGASSICPIHPFCEIAIGAGIRSRFSSAIGLAGDIRFLHVGVGNSASRTSPHQWCMRPPVALIAQSRLEGARSVRLFRHAKPPKSISGGSTSIPLHSPLEMSVKWGEPRSKVADLRGSGSPARGWPMHIAALTSSIWDRVPAGGMRAGGDAQRVCRMRHRVLCGRFRNVMRTSTESWGRQRAVQGHECFTRPWNRRDK